MTKYIPRIRTGHDELSNRELKEELKFEIARKNDLRKEVKELKREIERLKESKDAIKENETLKKEIESLKKEMAELKRAKDENNRKCDKCIEDLGQEENLREHILSKYAPKRFKCNVCGDMLRTESCMKKHEKSVHTVNSKREKLSKHFEELQSKIADQKIGILKDILAL